MPDCVDLTDDPREVRVGQPAIHVGQVGRRQDVDPQRDDDELLESRRPEGLGVGRLVGRGEARSDEGQEQGEAT